MSSCELSTRTKVELTFGSLLLIIILWLAIALAAVNDRCELPDLVWSMKEYLRDIMHRTLKPR